MGRRITNSQIKFKTLMLSSSLCGNSDAYIRVKGTIKIAGAGAEEDAKHTEKEISKQHSKIVHHLLTV